MKYEADRGYTDLQLNRHVDKGEELERIYNESEVELTKERISYLVDERKLYVPVEEKGIQETTENDNKEEITNEVEESSEEVKQKENESEEEAKEVETEEVKEDKEVVEDKINEEETTEETKKNTTKSKTKNTKKDDEK